MFVLCYFFIDVNSRHDGADACIQSAFLCKTQQVCVFTSLKSRNALLCDESFSFLSVQVCTRLKTKYVIFPERMRSHLIC